MGGLGFYALKTKLGRRSGFLGFCLTLAACGGDEETSPSTSDTSSYSVSIIGNCILTDQDFDLWEAHNAARMQARSCGNDFYEATGPLNWNCLLAEAAENHSADMAAQDYFDHIGQDGSSFSDRAIEVGYENVARGENIAAGQPTVESVVDGWLESDGHCANIMRAGHTEMGASGITAVGARYSIYWTAVFGAE